MYNSKLVASLKSNGKILREFADTVYIPYNSEYSILLKNLNTVRALVNVYVDGTDVTPNGLVIMAGQEVDLQRSLVNGNLQEGNRFKFIERTSSVENHRGIGLEDGLIRIVFRFEKIAQYNPNMLFGNYYTTDTYSRTLLADTRTVLCNAPASGITSIAHTGGAEMSATSAQANNVGITVPGSVSNQSFQTAQWFATEETPHTIILKVLGETPSNRPVTAPVTVKSRPTCITCGRKNKANSKFCSECGTGLEIV